MDKEPIHAELRQAGATFHQLLDSAAAADLRRRSDGTRWTNEQLLYHMLFGYLVVRALLPLVRLFGRLPPSASRAWARLLNSATRPFHVINYLGSVVGARVYNHRRMGAKLDRTLAALHRHLEAESDATLVRTMCFPTRWDPFFKDVMTLEEVYRYPTQHFDFHRGQLTLDDHSN
ncbi:DinB family protein [Streptomyces paradoxus]|uniref:DinB family protein n=1 Tax=Streptomyces paradoxus TaxID=66375 RepID=UPI00380B2A2F